MWLDSVYPTSLQDLVRITRRDMIDLQQEIILENERVILRPLQLSDTSNLKDIAIHQPELWKYSLTHITTLEDLTSYINKAIEGRKNGISYPFSVYDKKAGAYAGSTRYYDINAAHMFCSIGYTWYGKSYQRTGLNQNCKLLLLQYAFESMEVERVQFKADSLNEKSIRAIKNLGCKEEGVLRSHFYRPDGTRRDSQVLSMLRKEWLSYAKEGLVNKIR